MSLKAVRGWVETVTGLRLWLVGSDCGWVETVAGSDCGWVETVAGLRLWLGSDCGVGFRLWLGSDWLGQTVGGFRLWLPWVGFRLWLGSDCG